MLYVNLQFGTIIKGKWNKNSYKILNLLGEGGIGKVYKVQDWTTGEILALKMSDDIQSITKEYDMLQKFIHLPVTVKVKELDDFWYAGHKLHFIVMEYIQGKNLKEYIKNENISIKSVIGVSLIVGKTFHILHQHQLIFGDLKLENLMMDRQNNMVKLIDLGGVTTIGTGIREFTPMYDRASWGAGIRRADKEYDLFSLCMLMTFLLLGSKASTENATVDKMISKLKDVDISLSFIKLIHKGLNQKIHFEDFMIQLERIYEKGSYKPMIRKKKSPLSKPNFTLPKLPVAIDSIFYGSILLFVSILFLSIRNNMLF